MKTVLLFTGVFLTILPVVVPVHELHSVQQMGLGIVFCDRSHHYRNRREFTFWTDAFKKPKEQKEES
jgi:hypothetical protein